MFNISLDSVYNPPANKTTLFVIDCRVAVFKLLNLAHINADRLPHLVQWYFSQLPTELAERDAWVNQPEIIVVDDSRTKISANSYNYWREAWIRENAKHLPVYKGNRGVSSEDDRPDMYTELLEAIYYYCDKTNTNILKSEGFEADDFYGAIYRHAFNSPAFVERYETIICSVDNDLAQLVDDSLDIKMYVTGSFSCPVSRLRSEYEVLRYYSEKHDADLNCTYEIVDHKMEVGDAGDGIVPDSPREIIDLRNPPIKPDTRYVAKNLIGRTINFDAAIASLSHLRFV